MICQLSPGKIERVHVPLGFDSRLCLAGAKVTEEKSLPAALLMNAAFLVRPQFALRELRFGLIMCTALLMRSFWEGTIPIPDESL